jgi:hypothetical protein
MKTHLVSFTTTYQDIGFQDVELRQLRLIKSAKKFGINHFFTWNRQTFLKTFFYKQNKEILDHKIGAGYWLWKPYIILDALEKVNEGDFVIYLDNSMYFIDNPKPLLELCENENGILLFKHDTSNAIKYFTQQSTFKSMNLDIEQYKDKPMYCSNVQVYQKNVNSLSFIKEYLSECLNPLALIENYSNEIAEFKKHKHDMSILSLLANKYNVNGYRVPYQFGNHQKIEEFRKDGEFLLYGKYMDIDYNSYYSTILHWDKEGIGIKRNLFQKLNPKFIYYKLIK